MTQQLIDFYITQTLTKNKAPENVFLFATEAGISEAEFYKHFGSLNALENQIFVNWWHQTLNNTSQTDVYQNYSAQEKVLALFYTWIETLKNYRTFVLFLHQRDAKTMPPTFPKYLKTLFEEFKQSLKTIIDEGIANKEIVDRKFLSKKYPEGLWASFLFITNFWIKDESAAFEKTDESIEKTVNLAFELMRKSALDSALEFGKFLYQNK